MEDLHSLNFLNWENKMSYDKTDMILLYITWKIYIVLTA